MSKPTLSIRARLLVLALIAVAPLMIDRVRVLHNDRHDRIETAEERVLGLVGLGVERQQEVIVATRAIVQTLSRLIGAPDLSAEACARLVTDVAAGVPWITGIHVLNPNGRVRCSSRANAVGLDLSDRPHIQNALRTGRAAVSDYLVSRFDGQPLIAIAYPRIGSDGAVEAIITTGVSLEWIGRLVATLRQQVGSSVLLIDRQGTVLARHPDLADWVGRRVADHPLVRNVLAADRGVVRSVGLDGVRRIFGFRSLPSTNAHLAIGLDESEVLSRVAREMWIANAELGLVGLIVLLGIWFGGERLIVQPMRSLTRIATRFGRGELGARAMNYPLAAEIAPLAVALDKMARQLAEREDELRVANSHLEELVTLDGLSGLTNRRGFDAELETQWRRALKQRSPVSLLMIDVDHFKLFNDHHGHLDGDECLRSLAEVIGIAAAKGSFFAARYGGEEFALLLPGADIDSAVQAGERLRIAVEELRMPHTASPSGHVTVSVGVASLVPGPDDAAQALVAAADAALYDAKRRGRNIVVAHERISLPLAS